VILITEPHLHVDARGLADRKRDTLVLTWEERRWTRKRVTTTAGREVGLALPTGTVLRAGDIIAVAAEWYLAVEARPEPVLAASPRDPDEAIRLAFEVGNRHFSVAIDGGRLLVPDDTAMEQLLERLGVPWHREEAVYDPVSGGHRHDPAAFARAEREDEPAASAIRKRDGGPTASARHGREHEPRVPTTPELEDEPPAPARRPAALLSLLHFADSAFPTGGYTHSFGLERYCQAGIVTDGAGVERFLLAQIEGTAGPCDATAAVGVRAAFARGDVEECRAIDETLEAMKPVREFREGSRQMGRQTLRVTAALTGDGRVAAYRDLVDAGVAPGHHATAFGMAAAVLHWKPEETALAYLYSTTALLMGAALRLLPLGQTEGQRILWRIHPVIERAAREAAQAAPADLACFAPGLDIQGMLHERLESRLFRS